MRFFNIRLDHQIMIRDGRRFHGIYGGLSTKADKGSFGFYEEDKNLLRAHLKAISHLFSSLMWSFKVRLQNRLKTLKNRYFAKEELNKKN